MESCLNGKVCQSLLPLSLREESRDDVVSLLVVVVVVVFVIDRLLGFDLDQKSELDHKRQ